MPTLLELAELDLLLDAGPARFAELSKGESLAELLAFVEARAASAGLRLVDGTVEAPCQMSAAAYRNWARRQSGGVAERLLAPAGAAA